MGAAAFHPALDRAVSLARLVASEPRLRALLTLRDRGPTTVAELGAVMGVCASGVGPHLALLRSAGLVTAGRDERHGRCVLYRLREDSPAPALLEALGLGRGRGKGDRPTGRGETSHAH